MKQITLLKSFFLLCALMVGSSAWATDITATLSGSSMIIGTNPGTGYTDYTTTGATDDDDNVYYGRWCYQKSNNNFLNMIQLKKLESSNSTRIQLPQFSGIIKTITLTATNASATSSSGTGASTQMIIVNGTTYTKTFATTAENQVLTVGNSNTATNSFVFDFTSLEETYDGSDLYICTKDNSVRIWSIEVVYTEANYYNVTYKYNDGVTANKTIQVSKGDVANAYTLDPAPTRTNFTFTGWNDGTNTYNAGANYAITANTTFTAQWTFSGETTDYNRSTKSDLATGAQYIMAGVKDNVWGFATDFEGSNTYLGAGEFDENSTISASEAKLTSESPLVITLEETADGWYLKNSDGKKLGLTGDKKIAWNDGDMTWVLDGSDEVPTFKATNSGSDYTMYYNAGATRFNAYTSKGSNVDAYYYRLDDGKDVYTLTLDFNYGETTDEDHRVLEGATYTLTTPTRSGYAFTGWNTEEDGTGTNYEVGAYTMPSANTTLYAQWSSTVPATITAAEYATFNSAYATDFSTTGVTVYTAEDKETSVALNEVASGQVPANTPVVLYKAGGGNVNVPVIASATAISGTNDLHVSTGTDVENMYVLAMNPTIGFYPWTGTNLSAGKVYLQGKASYGAREFLGFNEGSTTAIDALDNLTNSPFDNAPMYNLAGQRVTKSYKGVVIVNGKKMLNK